MANLFQALQNVVRNVSIALMLIVGSSAFAGVNVWTGPWPSNVEPRDMQAISSTGKILATGFGAAETLYTSLDGGVSWSAELAVSGVGNNVGALGVDIANPNAVWVADRTVARLYRSIDGGKTFTSSTGYGRVNAIHVKGTDVYLATTDGVYRSQDRGLTFTRVAALSAGVAGITTTSDGTVFIAQSTGVSRSVNGGVTFTQAGLVNVSVNNLRAAADGAIYGTAGQNLYVTLDQGNSWAISVPASKVDLGAATTLSGLNVAPDNTAMLYINGSLARTSDRGNTWVLINGPFATNVAIVGVTQEAANPATVYAYNDRSDVLKSTDGGKQWQKISSACVTSCFDYFIRHYYVPTPIIFASSATLRYSTNGGATFTDAIFLGGTPNGIIDIAQAAPNSGTFYAGTGSGVFKSTNNGATWNKTSTGLPASSEHTSIAADSQNGNIVYTGVTNRLVSPRTNVVYKSVDGGNTWALAGLPLTTAVTSIKAVAGKTFVSTYGSGLFYSDNGGQTWSSRNAGTTIAKLTRVIVDPARPSNMFLAGEKGLVYQSIDAALNWSPINYRLPEVDVDDLIVSPDGKTLHIAMSYFPYNSGYYQYTISNSVIGPTTDVYRLYSPVLQGHFYTADANEYRVLTSTSQWIGEGRIYVALVQPGSVNGIATIPLYRLYSPALRRHLWTTDFNEYSVLGTLGWTPEGVAWHMSPQATELTIPIYRLFSEGLRKHFYTVDENEKNVLSNSGWKYEGVVGNVLRPN